jgi:hypothetical protein
VPLIEQFAKAFALAVQELLAESGDVGHKEEDIIHPARYYIEPQRFQMPTTAGSNSIDIVMARVKKRGAIPARVAAAAFLTRDHAHSIARVLIAEIHKAGHMREIELDDAESLIRSQPNDGQCFKQAYYPVKYA